MASRSSRPTRSSAASPSKDKKETPGSLLRFLFLVALIAWAFRSFLLQPFYIPSRSMLPTLYVGDYLAVAKWPYGYSRYSLPFGLPSFRGNVLGRLPRRGDIVVFRHPSKDSDLIKRVIGLPGDMIEVRSGRVILNGRMVERRALRPAQVAVSPNSACTVVPPAQPRVVLVNGRQACLYQAFLETLPGGPSYTVLNQIDSGPADDFPATRVPPGHLFLMGDNRDDSLDSRFASSDGGVGMLPLANLIGRAQFTFWSTDGSASYLEPWSWFSALRANRLGGSYQGVSR